MIIGVDAGALSIRDERLRVGVWRVTYNLLRELTKIDKKNEYRLYTFLPIDSEVMKAFGSRMKNVVVRPTIGWSKIQIPIELRRHPVDIFLGLSQMIPRPLTPEPARQSPDGSSRMADGRSDGGQAYSGAKNIGFVYDVGFLRFPDAYPGSLKRLEHQTERLVSRSEKIVTISEVSKADILKSYGERSLGSTRDDLRKSVAVAYPGVDERFTVTGKKHVEKNPYILFVGALKRGKNVPFALRVFKKFLAQSKKTYDFVLVGGDYWSDPEIQKTIVELDLKDRVKMAGFVADDELPSYYRGARALLVTSLWEGFCLPAAEAMRCGCPVVYAQSGSLPEIVGVAGVGFSIHTAEEGAKGLVKLATNMPFKKKLAAAGIKRSQEFTWPQFAKSIYRIISSE